MSLSGFLSFFGCNGNKKPLRETINYPPFSIQKRAVVDRQYKPNEGTVSKITYTKYKVLYLLNWMPTQGCPEFGRPIA